MRPPSQVRGASFNQVVNVIKGIRRSAEGATGNATEAALGAKIADLAPSVAFLMSEHPHHAPVLLHHLNAVTSRLRGHTSAIWAAGAARESEGPPEPSCKNCNGLCNRVYGEFLAPVSECLDRLGAKGLSQVVSAYAECRAAEAARILRECCLRICYFVYCGCKKAAGARGLDETDAIVDRHAQQIAAVATQSPREGDYLRAFFSRGAADVQPLVRQSRYFLPVNLMDVCTTLEALAAGHGASREAGGLRDLMLALSLRFLALSSFTQRPTAGGDAKIEFARPSELDTVCRLMGLFKRLRHRDQLLSSLVPAVLAASLADLDLRNLSTLLDALAFYSAEASKVDFPAVIAQIGALAAAGDASLRSLSTLTHVLTKLDRALGVRGYGDFVKIARGEFSRQLAGGGDAKTQEALSALALALKALPDAHMTKLVCECVLDDLLPFGAASMYDYNLILEVLLRVHRDGSGGDAGPVAAALCLLVTRCAQLYAEMLAGAARGGRIDLRELCFFLKNVTAFKRLDVAGNAFREGAHAAVAALTGALESFFTRNHTRLPDLDHTQISRFLAQ